MAKRGDEQNRQQRSIGREIGQALTKELGFALNSARQEIVEKGWFGEKVTPQIFDDLRRDYSRDAEIFGGQQSDRDTVYGRDPEPQRQEPASSDVNWDSVRDVSLETADKSRPLFDLSRDARWQSHKDQAEQLYGPDGSGGDWPGDFAPAKQTELSDLYGPDDVHHDNDAALFGEVPGISGGWWPDDTAPAHQTKLSDLYGPDLTSYDQDAAIFGEVPGMDRDRDQEMER